MKLNSEIRRKQTKFYCYDYHVDQSLFHELYLAIDVVKLHAGNADIVFLLISTKGTPYTQQSYKVSDVFPFKWINKKWKEGFSVTSMTTAGSKWGIVMSRNAGYPSQVVPFQSNNTQLYDTATITYMFLFLLTRLLNLISSIQVREFIEDGRKDIGLHQQQLHRTKLHSYLVHPRENHKI